MFIFKLKLKPKIINDIQRLEICNNEFAVFLQRKATGLHFVLDEISKFIFSNGLPPNTNIT